MRFRKLDCRKIKLKNTSTLQFTRLLQKNFNLETTYLTKQGFDPKDFIIPSLEGNVIVLINGLFSKEHSSIISPEAEVQISNLSDALASGDRAGVKTFLASMLILKLMLSPRGIQPPGSMEYLYMFRQIHGCKETDPYLQHS